LGTGMENEAQSLVDFEGSFDSSLGCRSWLYEACSPSSYSESEA
jgi:hypothetical protein